MITSSEITDRPLVVLVADDEMLLRMLAVEVLSENGCVTIEAANAAAALEVIGSQADDIDVLFTDIRMPGEINGLDLAHCVRYRWPWIGIVVVSGNIFVTPKELPDRARFLRKPYDMDHVVDVIREVARRDVRGRRHDGAGRDYDSHGPGSSGAILAD